MTLAADVSLLRGFRAVARLPAIPGASADYRNEPQGAQRRVRFYATAMQGRPATLAVLAHFAAVSRLATLYASSPGWSTPSTLSRSPCHHSSHARFMMSPAAVAVANSGTMNGP